jgi:hypothetical protein
MQLASVEYDLVFPEIDYKHKFDIHAEDFIEMVTYLFTICQIVSLEGEKGDYD